MYFVFILQVWLAREGREMGTINGRGVGVRPCVFFHDNVRAASAQEGGVLVSSFIVNPL